MADNKVSQESQPVSRGGGNTSTPPRGRSWCFTVNNYTQLHIDSVVSLVSGSELWIYAFETGQNGTPHIQGYVKFKHQVRFTTLKRKIPDAHWEKAKGSPDQNYNYCAKDGDFYTNMQAKVTRQDLLDKVRQEYTDVKWQPWQQDVIDLIDADQSKRTIFWIFEPTGNVGKTYLAKFLCLRPGTILCSGKRDNVFNQVNVSIDAGKQPLLVIADIPRVAHDYISYEALECLKNGLLYSGKYEGGQCVFPSPTVICFSNENPDFSKLSLDRWKTYSIQDQQLIETV